LEIVAGPFDTEHDIERQAAADEQRPELVEA
jgi:hypothetical protein